MSNPFATPAMAEGYARARPPLHERIVERAAALLALRPPLEAALDLGCGSGLSTRPLLRLARRVVAFDPAHAMSVIAGGIASPARTLTARAEALPFRSGSFDLITAAGSLNYTEPAAVFRQAARILSPGGCFVAYDFSQGRASTSTPALAVWFESFLSRYPMPPGEALHLDPASIAGLARGFTVLASELFQMPVRMDSTSYSAYLMTETNVAAAIRGGASESEIRRWLSDSLAPVFSGAALEVVFPGYVICLRAA
jgi:SAM-dependent methyltransferase